MASCFFPFCLSGGVQLPDPSTAATHATVVTRISKQKKKLSRCLIDSSSGTMKVPTYRTVSRDNCPLLRLAWEQRWQQLANRCVSHPQEAQCLSEHSRRTALHLALLSNSPFPVECAKALLKANRHLVLVQDKENYTPLHIACFFSRRQYSALPANGNDSNTRQLGTSNSYYTSWCRRLTGEAHDCNDMISLFCDTAIMVEQELQQRGTLPQLTGVSPLFLACKRDAPLSLLRILSQTRHQPSVASLSATGPSAASTFQGQNQRRAKWIAPSTGGEPYWDSITLDEYSSPLEILLRDRAPTIFEPLLVQSAVPRVSEDKEWNSRVYRIMRKVAYACLTREDCTEKDRRFFQYQETNQKESGKIERSEVNARIVQEEGDEDVEQLSVEDCKAILLWEKCIELLASSNHIPRLHTPKPRSVGAVQPAIFPFGVVHAVACLKVPIPVLLQLTLNVFPEQCLLRDQTFGMIPLHHVLEARHPYATKKLLSVLLSHEPASTLKAFPPCVRASPSYGMKVCDNQKCDGCFSGSRCQENNYTQEIGPSPLIRAMELNLHYDLIKELLLWATVTGDTTWDPTQDICNDFPGKFKDSHCSNPLDFPDPKSGLFPFAVAASQEYDLTVVYTLLLANPQVMLHICNERAKANVPPRIDG